MGLFSSVLHLRNVQRAALLPALDKTLAHVGFARAETLPIPPRGPFAISDHRAAISQGPYYLLSELQGRWVTVVESHFAIKNVPHLSVLGKCLSAVLGCAALTLVVHDDDLFLYNLECEGDSLDGYNSYPQYFERERLTEEEVEAQRHSPEAFEPFLPPGRSLTELQALLNRGWWNAHDAGALDEHGVPLRRDDGFTFEGERMTAFGTMLELHGTAGEYPYAAWGESQAIPWSELLAVRYSPRSG